MMHLPPRIVLAQGCSQSRSRHTDYGVGIFSYPTIFFDVGFPAGFADEFYVPKGETSMQSSRHVVGAHAG